MTPLIMLMDIYQSIYNSENYYYLLAGERGHFNFLLLTFVISPPLIDNFVNTNYSNLARALIMILIIDNKILRSAFIIYSPKNFINTKIVPTLRMVDLCQILLKDSSIRAKKKQHMRLLSSNNFFI